ncbi:MAG: hypothetical protein RBU30_17700 [Polyangia bacterium]|nr:hypothetical protein [Polyangia bacterium]
MRRKPVDPSAPIEPQLNEEQLLELERLGGLMFTVSESRVILGLAPGDWQEGSPAWTSYHRGRLRSEAECREAIRRSAAQGSAPGQKMWLELSERVRPRVR